MNALIAQHLQGIRALCREHSVKRILDRNTLESFLQNEDEQIQMDRSLYMIGEAINQIRQVDPEITNPITGSTDLISLRNRLAHAYHLTSYSLLWKLALEHLDLLVREVNAIALAYDEQNPSRAGRNQAKSNSRPDDSQSKTMTQPRIVITGMGWITPLGHDIESVWQALLAGESGMSPIGHFDASTYPTSFAAQVKDYDYADYVKDPTLHEGIGRNTAYALGAATLAWKAARLDEFDATGKLDHDQLGIYLGSGEGIIDFDNHVAANLASWDAEKQQVNGNTWTQVAKRRMNFLAEVEQEPNMPLSHVAMEFEARGPSFNCLTACAASTQAIGEATEILRRGDAQIMLTGGAHTMIHPFGVTGFNRLTALSNRNDSPTTASRPFSVDRDGFVMGEGGGIMILETLDHAQARNAPILAEVAGYGSTADAYRITDMHPEGRGAVAAMKRALEDAGVTLDDIDYISAHGTSTKENDSIETRAIKALFGDRAKQVPVSSTKSMLGHLIAAAGVSEAMVCVLALRDQILPPTMNLHNPDPECDLDYIPNEPRKTKVHTVLSNSFGFGGQNDTLILRKYQ